MCQPDFYISTLLEERREERGKMAPLHRVSLPRPLCYLSGTAAYSLISSVSVHTDSKIRYALGTAHRFRPVKSLTPITVTGGLADAAVRVAQSQYLARPNDDLEFRPHTYKPPVLPDGWIELLDSNDQLCRCQTSVDGSNQWQNESTPLMILFSGWLHLPIEERHPSSWQPANTP